MYHIKKFTGALNYARFTIVALKYITISSYSIVCIIFHRHAYVHFFFSTMEKLYFIKINIAKCWKKYQLKKKKTTSVVITLQPSLPLSLSFMIIFYHYYLLYFAVLRCTYL